MLKWLWLSVVVIGLDQVTKYYAEGLLNYYEQVPITPFFNLTLMHNTGAAFSFLSEAGGWQRWFFVVLAFAICAYFSIWLRKLQTNEFRAAIALSLIIGGAIGNVIDRLLHGFVIDFIQLHYHDWYWPAFNVADSAITCGVIIMLFDSFISKPPNPPSSSNSNNSAN